ncbi:LrgB family protein [Clostridium sp. 'White wine YQ']|uniref:LrgB family protein n=1 Tax=Clostridium sp. 'White wine YQ' TaxID=3027474 RepID=UPI0023670CFB|nr:LrgB family protein [Clostridium sp. 'White wine YQ']MDD7794132.1 LrgB family protein [Clostridium sp. 'White wine YQ']
MSSLLDSPIFGILLSLFAFEIGMILYNRTKFPLFNPLLIAIVLIIGFLGVFKINYQEFNIGGQFINMFLGPATVVLAVPLYKQLKLLQKHALPIILGVLIGSSVGIFSIIGLSYILGLNGLLTKSLLAKSVSTPIGMEITKSLNGVIPITVIAIIITGILGAIIGPWILKTFRIHNKIAVGISLGTSAHAVGTSKALELGETEGAMSSLSIGIAGLMTVALAPLIYHFAIYIYSFIK